MAAALLGWTLLNTNDPTPTPGGTQPQANPPPAPDHSLTNTEALDRFRELDALRIESIETGDVSLIPETLTPDGPLRDIATEEARQLATDMITVQTNFRTINLRVLSNSEDEVVIRQVVLQNPRFFSESGKEVTTSNPRLRTIEWTLKLDGDTWKIHNSKTVRDRPAR